MLCERINADHYCAFMHPFVPNSHIRTRLKRSNGKSSKQFQKSLFMYLKSVLNLNKLCILKLSEYQNKLLPVLLTGHGKDR